MNGLTYITDVFPNYQPISSMGTPTPHSKLPIPSSSDFENIYQKFLQSNSLQFNNKPFPPYQVPQMQPQMTYQPQNFQPTQLQNFQDQQEIPYQENFGQNEGHKEYITHILSCNQCKNIMMKNFSLQMEKEKNEQILELIFFVSLVIFIILF